jgi:hypothetical protein
MDSKTYIDAQVNKAKAAGKPLAVRGKLDSDLARYLLTNNGQNRPLRAQRALRYREDMLAGAWADNGETLKIDTRGCLADGQHRCAAIAETDIVLPVLFVFGVTVEATETIDQGAARNAGDYLQMRGEPNAAYAARIVRLRLAFEREEGAALKDISRPTNAQVLHYFGDHKADVLESAAKAAELRDAAQPLIAPAVLGFAHNVLHEINPAEADAYIEQVAKGEDIHEGDPAFAVRARLLKMGRTGAAAKAEALFAGWNAFHEHRPLKSVRLTGRLPELAH